MRFRAGFRASDRSRVVLGGPQIASCGLVFGWAVVERHDSAGFGCAGSAGGCRRAGRSVARALGCRWARVDDVSKSRCLGLVEPAARLALRGPFYARSGVTLAPAFLAAAARQSVTSRL